MITEKELLNFKAEISQAKEEKSRLEGRLQHLKEQLSETWGCKTAKEAEKKLTTLDKEIDVLGTSISIMSQELEDTYFTDDDH